VAKFAAECDRLIKIVSALNFSDWLKSEESNSSRDSSWGGGRGSQYYLSTNEVVCTHDENGINMG